MKTDNSIEHIRPDSIPTDPPQLINAEQLAQILSISQRTLWRLLSAKKLIPPIRIGGNTRWRLNEVHQWIDAGCPEP
jgi:predicted DNA-binding transcriptional regulator AlpA